MFDAISGNLIRTYNDPTTASTNGRFGLTVSVHGNHVLIGGDGDITNGSVINKAHLFDATTGNLLQTFNDPTVSDRENFGYSIALDGNFALIGSPYDDSNGKDVGQAHLFDATTGNLLQTFNDPTITDRDNFGFSIAVYGNHVLIGASGDDTNGIDVGQAHLFDATTGNLLQTFDNPTRTSDNGFGVQVALDGNHVLIGAPEDDTKGTDVGQAYLFNATTGNLLYSYNDPTVTGRDLFGVSVALDGNHTLIGAIGDDTNGFNVGQVYLFEIVPEPGTACLLLGMGLIAASFCDRRNN